MANRTTWFSIPEWYGIQQHKDGTLLPPGTAYDARNIETGDGNLSTAKGFTAVSGIPAIPGLYYDKYVRLIMIPGESYIYVVREDSIFFCDTSAATPTWYDVYHLPDDTHFNWADHIQAKIGTKDALLISTGVQSILCFDVSTGNIIPFASGLYSFEGTVSAYDSSSLEVTLSSAPGAEAARRCLAYGITIGDEFCEVDSVSSTKVYLKYAPNVAPEVGDAAKIRGGGSDAKVKFLEMYMNRLFASGDPDAPCRLYWSAVPGDGRTIADWLSVDGSYDASGGYVEVGDNDNDPIIGMKALSNQIIIWKRYSVWRLYGDRPSTFTLECIDRTSSFMCNSGVITKYNTPYFLMPDGIYTYDGSNIVPVDGGNRILRRFFELGPDVSNSRAVCCNNRFYLTCKLPKTPASTYDNAVIVYDVARGSYMIRDGFEIADMTVVDSHIYMLTKGSNIVEFEKGTTYGGANINTYWLSQPMDFGTKMYRRQLIALFAHLKGDSVKVTALGDHGNTLGTVVRDTIRDDYTTMRFQADQSYFVQLKFENINGGTFSLLGGVNANAEFELKE